MADPGPSPFRYHLELTPAQLKAVHDALRSLAAGPGADERTRGIAAEVLAMRPEEVCLVAAHNGDLAAARRCGLRTAFVARPTEHGPGQTKDLSAEEDWDVVAEDFVTLAGRLGC